MNMTYGLRMDFAGTGYRIVEKKKKM